MIRQGKITKSSLRPMYWHLQLLLAGSMVVANVWASDFQYEYEEESTPSLIKEVYNLKKLAELSRKNHTPILIEFSTPWCSYCEALEKDVLEPMLRNDEYRDRVIIRKLEVSDYNDVIDFSGRKQDSITWAMSKNVDLFPTMVFFNGEGNEIGRRLTGITVLEFIADEVDQALADVRKKQ